MDTSFVVVTGIHWAAIIVYVIATIANTYGLIFKNEKAERFGYIIAVLGLLVHGIAIVYWWRIVGHGPYTARHEVFSSYAWVILFMFLLFVKFFRGIRVASIFIFPATFLLVALAQFFSPQARKLPPALKSLWLVLHVTFYKIALGTILIAVVFSIFYILKKRTRLKWLDKLPDSETVDIFAYRFVGFGFTFWAIAMLAGSIWANQSWGRFWAWDPTETWSLITWIAFGIYLHLRRFFGWKGERAAYFFIVCFLLSIIAIFFTPLIESSIHSEYPFK